jgi:hypothetical protein
LILRSRRIGLQIKDQTTNADSESSQWIFQPPSVAQVSLPLAQPSLLIRHSQRIQVLRRRRPIIHPFSQQRPAVDDIDGEFAVLVFVSEIAP